MAEINFTKANITNLPQPQTGKRTFYRDTKIPGLGIRVTSNGTKTFVVYRKITGKPERITLGRYPAMTVEQARKKAQQVNGEIAKGLNPQEAKRRERHGLTLGELHKRYMEDCIQLHQKRDKNPESYYRLYLNHWQHRKLSATKRADVRELHAKIKRRKSHITANRVLTLLRAMYNWAKREDLFEGENPTNDIDKFSEKSRERFLQPDEMPRFFRALADEPNETVRDFVLMCLLTGARRSNVQEMRWDQINFGHAVWTIPETKAGDSHHVPLLHEALVILAKRKDRAEGLWVFPGTGKTGHLVEPKRSWAKILERADIKDLRLHDLRRTLGSWQAATGANLSVIGKTLAHKNVSSTAVYARLNLDTVREAMQRATTAMLDAGAVREKVESD